MRNTLKSKKGNKVIKAAMFGSLAGVVTGLLLAPKSGLELRQDLAVQAHEIGDKSVEIRDKAQSAWLNVEDKTQVTVNTGKSLIQKGKRLVSNLKILVYEIQHGALTKTVSIYTSENKDSGEPTSDIPIIENEHEY
jgi:gas vesicle protein